jgi:WD40 repeat protein
MINKIRIQKILMKGLLTVYFMLFVLTGFSQNTMQLTLQTGHSDDIQALAFSEDGKYLASGGKDNVIIVWDFLLGKEIRRLKGHTGPINDLKFINNGILISAGEDGKIVFWDLVKGKAIRVLNNKSGVRSIDVNSDNTLLVSAGPTLSLKIWSLTDTTLVPYDKFYDVCSTVAFNPKGDEVIFSMGAKKNRGTYLFNVNSKDAKKISDVKANSCTFDKTGAEAVFSFLHSTKLCEFDLQKSRFRYTRPGDYARFHFLHVVVSPDNSMIAAGNNDNCIYIFDRQSGKRKSVIYGFQLPPLDLKFHPLKNDLIVFTEGKAIIVWNVKENKLIRKIESSVSPVTAAGVNADGKFIAFAGTDNSVKVYDLKNNIKTNYFPGHNANISGVSFVSATDTIVSAGLDNRMHYWQLNDTNQKRAIKVARNPMVLLDKIVSAAIPLSVGGNMLTMFFLGKSFFIKNYETLNTIAESKDKKYTATGGGGWRGFTSAFVPRNFPIYIYNNKTQKREYKLWGHYYRIKSLAFSCNNDFLASCGENESIMKIWDLKRKKLIDLYYNPYHISALVFNNTNDSLAFTDIAQNVVLFDIKKDTAIKLSLGRAPLFFNNTGNRIFFQDQHYNIVQYDLVTRKVLNTFSGHNDLISSASLVEDGSRMVTASWDGTVKLWDVAEGKEIATFIALNETDYIVKSPDNYYFATKKAKKEIGFSSGIKFYPFEQFDLKYNRPDILLQRIGHASPELVDAYRQAYKKRLQRMHFTEDIFNADLHLPEINIINRDSLELKSASKNIVLNICAKDSKYKLDRINIWVNDVPLLGISGIDLRDLQTDSVTKKIPIELSSGMNKIQLSCLNEKGVESLKETIELNYENKNEKHDLYIIAMSVSNYKDTRFNLAYAGKDGRDMVKLFESEKANYNHVYDDTLFDKNATIEKFSDIKQKLMGSKVDDEVIVFISGHGLLNDSLDFYFATYDCDFEHPDKRGISYESIENLLDGIPARKKLLMMDACHSGEVDKEELIVKDTNMMLADGSRGGLKTYSYKGINIIKDNHMGLTNSFELMQELFTNLNRGSGAMVISAAAGKGYALESKEWNNGVFTYAVINGLRNKSADLNKDGKVNVSELRDYVVSEVVKLTNGAQRPTCRKDNTDFDFRIW